MVNGKRRTEWKQDEKNNFFLYENITNMQIIL